MNDFSKRLTITPNRKANRAKEHLWKIGDETEYSELGTSKTRAANLASAYVYRLTATESPKTNYRRMTKHNGRTHNYFPINTSSVMFGGLWSKPEKTFGFPSGYGWNYGGTLLVVAGVSAAGFILMRLGANKA